MPWLDDAMREARTGAALRAARRPLASLLAEAAARPAPRGFAAALRAASPGAAGAAPGAPPAVIAEIKFASPSRGVLRADRDVEAVARAYARGGATALSVLVDTPRFAGHPSHLRRAALVCDRPLLAKGFFAVPYQLAEMRLAGADAVLLIATLLTAPQLAELHAAAAELGLDALVEVHAADDLARLAGLPVALVGVNQRDLATLAMGPAVTADLAPLLPAGAVRVAESGIATRADLARVAELGYDAALVGTSLMTATDPGAALAALLAAPVAREARHGG